MVTPVNDRDVMLQAAASRDVDPLAGRYVQVDMSAQLFHVSSANQGSPSTITLTAIPVNIVGGTPTFSTDNGTLTGTGVTRTLAFSSLTGDTANITVSITDNNGNTFTTKKVITKLYDGANGTGTPGAQYATAFLYQFSTVAPSKPSGTSTYNWTTGNNTVYTANDGWTVTVPANNGNPLASLYVVAVPVTAAGGATSSLVSYASAAVQAWSQNGAKGDTGSSGMQYATASIYQQNANTPTGPVGPATWNWAAGTFDYIPSGWTLNPPATLPVGYTLWAARVSLVTSATSTQTAFNWNAAAISAIGYAGTNGTGQTGAAGSSYVTAYCASTTATTSTTPATTTGINSVPAQNDGGITGTWLKTVPQLVSGQYLYVTDGIFDPSTGKVTWSIPYWSSFKVGSLSALSGVMGRLTISDVISDAGNNWTIDSTGKMTCKSWQLLDSNGTVVLQAGSALNAAYAAAGTLNSALTPSIAAAATTATWAGVSGTGKPADNATYGLVSAANILSGGTGIVAGNLTWDGSGNRIGGYGTVMNQKGFAAYNSGGVLTFMVDASNGAVTARALTILGPGDVPLLSTGRTFAEQAYSNPNLCPTPIGMYMYGGATGNRNGDVRFGDGQYIWLPPTGDNSYCGAQSGPLGIPGNSAYTVSFDAYTTDASGRYLNVDVAGTGVDSIGGAWPITPTLTRYRFTENMPASGTNGDGQLRMFTVQSGGGSIVISSIKVELGNTMTPWCDSVLTAANSSTFIQSAAIRLAHIDKASIGSLDAITARIGTLQTATWGQRSQLSDNGLQIFNSNNLAVIQIGFF